MRRSKTNTKTVYLNQKTFKTMLIRNRCEEDHLFFSRYFFKNRQSSSFIVNWHHRLIADVIDDVFSGKRQNVVINVPPGSSKTELVIINLIARGLAINPRARFLHLSYSDDLALLNSQTARDIIRSDAYQELWPLKISDDTKSRKRWNVMVDGQLAGGVYATSLSGQVTGFRAGHMLDGFNGCILLDDLLKSDDAFSKTKLDSANRKILTTIKSRKANPSTPIILIMQRICENDPVGFIQSGAVPGKWDFITIPAVMDEQYIGSLDPKYRKHILRESDRVSYWPYKEPLEELLAMERGDGTDQTGARISRQVFSSQYQQNPVPIGGNLIRSEYFGRYQVLPKLKWRKIFADTAQKTKERNDFSVLFEAGLGVDGRGYLVSLTRGKWEAPELQRRAISFWASAKARDVETHGQLREMIVEDKSSGTGLIQTVKLPPYNIPIKGIERSKDKLTRVMDALPYIEAGLFFVPEEAPFTNDFLSECEAFTSDDTHMHDDQVDTLIDSVMDLLSTSNKLKIWESVGG